KASTADVFQMSSKSAERRSPRTITLLLKVDDNGYPVAPTSKWRHHLEQRDELWAGRGISSVLWRTGKFSKIQAGDRIFIIASHPDQEHDPTASKQRGIIGY